MYERALVFDISSEGLEPVMHKILGITVKTEFKERIFTNRDEKKILEEFWKFLKEGNYDKIIGFNSSNFDVPMLIVRSIKNNIRMLKINEKFIDLRKIIFKEEHKKGKLQDFQNLLGIEILENGFAKMHMSLLWETPEIPKLREYLLQDVRITWKLYLRFRQVGLL